jgi:hypothetical protein
MKDMPEISVKTWNRFVTNNMHVSADLMGLFHEFEFEGRSVYIRLPEKEHADKGEGFDQVARLYSWHSVTEEPILYCVARVDVEVYSPESISVPDEALSKPPKQAQHFSVEQREVADTVCEELAGVARRAFQYWLEIIRWVSGGALIGQPEVSGFESGWSTYLMDVSTSHRVWASTVVVTIHAEAEIIKEHWDKAEEHLRRGDVIPMHIRFMHDAKTSRRNEQFEKAIIDTAMACEIYLRYSVFEHVPDATPKKIRKYIEGASVSQYINHFFKDLVPKDSATSYKKVAEELSSLMDKRNQYLHMGLMHDSSDAQCSRFIDVAERLFGISLKNDK